MQSVQERQAAFHRLPLVQQDEALPCDKGGLCMSNQAAPLPRGSISSRCGSKQRTHPSAFCSPLKHEVHPWRDANDCSVKTMVETSWQAEGSVEALRVPVRGQIRSTHPVNTP